MQTATIPIKNIEYVRKEIKSEKNLCGNYFINGIEITLSFSVEE